MKKRYLRRFGRSLAVLALCGGVLLTMPPADAAAAIKPAELRPDFVITIDGAERDFFNAEGGELQPIVYDGTTYLPLRAIGELMGKNVDWDSKKQMVSLFDSLVTDADTFSGAENKDSKPNNLIMSDKALAKALDHAGLKAGDVILIANDLELDDGRYIYDIEFVAGVKEYDYEIDAVSGKVLSRDIDD